MFLGDLSPFSVLICSHPSFPKKPAVLPSQRFDGAGSVVAAAEPALSLSNGSAAPHDLRPPTSDLRLLRSVAALADSRCSSFSS
jgi:hypothetical protein